MGSAGEGGLVDHGDDIPTTSRGGVAAARDVVPLVVAVDVEKRGEEDLKFHAGAEHIWDRFALRAGSDPQHERAQVRTRYAGII